MKRLYSFRHASFYSPSALKSITAERREGGMYNGSLLFHARAKGKPSIDIDCRKMVGNVPMLTFAKYRIQTLEDICREYILAVYMTRGIERPSFKKLFAILEKIYFPVCTPIYPAVEALLRREDWGKVAQIFGNFPK